ncbi:MAG: LLM class flavin-dependent oxidoreductase, partial [Dehalococcoidia bacterium]|nr:LLM class flavin-dependent oxidoreductase [Dehalococcoidia bacterium]
MLTLPVGLGLAARGDPDDVADWSRQAADRGLDSVWVHDSYFERDAISFATVAARAVADGRASGLRVALGAVNPYTRHPVVLAMTGSALDEVLPGRVVMGVGTGLPLRLGQMGIPYDLATAPERLSQTIDQLRTLWAGERLPSATPGLPPIQPMFAPPKRIPIAIAAYRKELVAVAGAKADGYLARPAESIPSLRGILGRLGETATAAGRDPAAIETAGYLLALADSSRREALNRAKREPFVIYMMSILSDVSLLRAGFERELRDRVAAAWRAEDYTLAGNLIPDELLRAFILCGTREEIAEGALRFREEAGLRLPLLQPVVQEERQVQELLAAARLYGDAKAARGGTASAEPVAIANGREERQGAVERVRRLAGGAWEVVRPFAYTASAVPVAIGGAVAAADDRFAWLPFVEAMAAGLLLHSGTNVVNEIYDVRKGVDSITSPRASHALVKGRLTERGAFAIAFMSLALALALGAHLVYERGPLMLLLGLAGVAGGWGYTAPPLQYKYHALGIPLVFLLMGPLMVEGSYFAVTGGWSGEALLLSVPVGLLVAAILHGNEWRDI